jgi:hypothetical protein
MPLQSRGRREHLAFVMRGLDPRIHPLEKSLAKKMDGRVKPGHDGSVFATARLSAAA